MGTIKNRLNLETAVEFSRRGVGLNMDAFQEAASLPPSNTFPFGNIGAPPVSLPDLLATPGVLVPSVLRSQKPDDGGILGEEEFLFCEPKLPIEIETENCPTCRKDPTAFIPDWFLEEDGFDFYNPRECTYCVVVESEVFNTVRGERLDLLVRRGINRLIKKQQKADEITAVIYVPLVNLDSLKKGDFAKVNGKDIESNYLGKLLPGKETDFSVQMALPNKRIGFQRILERFDTRAELYPIARNLFDPVKHIFNPIQSGLKTKILVSIPVEIMDLVPLKGLTQPEIQEEIEKQTTPLEVSINGRDYPTIVTKIARNLRRASKYARNMEETPDGKKFASAENPKQIVKVDFDQAAENLVVFRKNYLDPAIRSALGVRIKKIENIIINIDFAENDPNKLLIKEVTTKKVGCPAVKLSQYIETIQTVKDLFAYSDARTLGYVSKLPDMLYELEGKNEIDWINFIVDYTFPPLIIAGPEILIDDNNRNDDIRCIANKSLNSLVSELINSSVEFVNLFFGQVSTRLCEKPSESEERYAHISELRQRLSRVAQTRRKTENLNILNQSRQTIIQEQKRLEQSVSLGDVSFSETYTAEQIKEIYKSRKKEAIEVIKEAKSNIKKYGYLGGNRSQVFAYIPPDDANTVRTNSSDYYDTLTDNGRRAQDIGTRRDIRTATNQALQKQILDNFERHINGTYNSLKSERPLAATIVKQIFPKKLSGEEPTSIEDLFSAINGNGGWCAWMKLIIEATQCLFKGMQLGDIREALLRSVLKALTPFELQKLFRNFPTEVREKIYESLKQNLEILLDSGSPWPWDRDYLGTNSYDINTARADAFNQKYLEIYLELKENCDERATNARFLLEEAARRTAPQEDSRRAEFLENRRNELLNSDKGSNVAEAIGGTFEDIFEIFVDAIKSAIGFDSLLEFLDDLPGFGLVKKFFKDIECFMPELPMIDPPLDSFMKTLRFDICNIGKPGWIAMKLPSFDPPAPPGQVAGKLIKEIGIGIKNFFKILGETIRDVLIDLGTQLLIKALTTILNSILDFVCDLMGDAVARLADYISGNNKFTQQLKNAMCPNDTLTDQQFAEGLKNVLTAFNGDNPTKAKCASALSPQEVATFMDNVIVTLSYPQLFDLVNGEATSDVLNIIKNLASIDQGSCIATIFDSTEAVNNFFKGLGTLVNAPAIFENFPDNVAIGNQASVCPPENYRLLENFRKSLLEKRGLNQEEIENQLEFFKNEAQRKLEDLANSMMNGPFEELSNFSAEPDASCPATGILKRLPANALGIDSVVDSIIKPIEKRISHNLIGGEDGILNNVMADTNGKTLKSHNITRTFLGNSIGQTNTGLEFYSDNTIRKSIIVNGQLKIENQRNGRIDQFGQKLEKSYALTAPVGGYPPTIGAYLMKKMKDFSIGIVDYNTEYSIADFKQEKVNFKSRRLQPTDLQAREAVLSYNDNLIRLRKEFVAKWAVATRFIDTEPAKYYISENFTDATIEATVDIKTKSDYLERLLAFDAMMNACNKVLFYDKDSNYPDYSGEQRAVRILGQKSEFKSISYKGLDWGLSSTAKDGALRHVKKNDPNRIEKYETVIFDPGSIKSTQMARFYLECWFADKTDSEYYVPFTIKGQIIDKNTGLKTPPIVNPYELGFSYVSYPKPVGFSMKERTLSSPDYAFDLTYDLQIEDTKGNLVPEKINSYRVVLTEKLNPFNDENFNKGKDGLASFYKTINEVDEDGNLGSAEEDSSLVEGSAPSIIGGNGEVIKFVADIPSVPSREVLDYITFTNKAYFPFDLSSVDFGLENEFMVRSFASNMDKNNLSSVNNLSILNSPNNRAIFKEFFDYINSGLVRRLANRIGNGSGTDLLPEYDSGKEVMVSVPQAFRFGYDPTVMPTVIFLDPSKYGGTDSNPPFYLKPPEYKGWLGLLQALMPEKDGCEPRRIPIYSLIDVKRDIKQLENVLRKDERLSFESLCTVEAPFDLIYDNATIAAMDGVIKSTTRVYILDLMLRVYPVIGQFKLNFQNNLDDLFASYASDHILKQIKYTDIKRDIRPVGRVVYEDPNNPKNFVVSGQTAPRANYYYSFLEQVANTIIKKIDSGVIKEEELTDIEKQALSEIRQEIKRYYEDYEGTEAVLSEESIQTQDFLKRFLNQARTRGTKLLGNGSSSFDKIRAKRIKNSISYLSVRKMETQCVILYNIYVKEQINKLSASFNEKLNPPIDRLDLLFVSSPYFVNGAVQKTKDPLTDSVVEYYGPYDVQHDITDPDSYNIDDTKFTNIDLQSPSDSVFVFDNSRPNMKWPFVLEKYVRINDKEFSEFSDTDIELRDYLANKDVNLRQVSNLQKFQEFLDNMKSDLTQTNYLKISEVFKSGLPITDTNQESPTFGQQIIKETGLKFGIRLSLIFDKENQFALPFEELSKYHNPLSRRENKSYLLQTPSGEKTVVPIAFGELDVKDQMLANFSIDQYDYPCLIKEMVDSIEFRSMFDYVFPMRRYLSLLTIYTANSFYDSIGNAGPPSEGGDRWTVPGGKRNGGFKNWDKEAVFHKKIPAGTSIVLMNSFLALYKTRNKLAPPAQNDDRDNEFNLAQILQQLIPTDIVADIPWWARRNRIDRPYDAFGNECVEEIDDDQI